VAIAPALQDTTARTATTDVKPFRIALETQRAECLRQRELAMTETATSVPDAVAVSRAASLGRTIAEIDAALERIAAGSYGICTGCGTAIPLPRLEVRPFAATCVGCAGSPR
jgi:DnaK suppressor protein